MGVCYRLLVGREGVDEALYRQLGAASWSQALVLVGDFNHPDIAGEATGGAQKAQEDPGKN